MNPLSRLRRLPHGEARFTHDCFSASPIRGGAVLESNNGEVFMGIDKNEWGFRVGHLPHGERNKISDVPGVTVEHCQQQSNL